MNGVYMRALPVEEYAERLLTWLREQGYDWPEDRVHAAAPLVQEKIGRFGEFPDFAGFLFREVEPDPALLDARILGAAEAALGSTEPWTTEAIEASLKQLCDDLGEKPRTVYLPIRVAVTGSRVSPGLYESLELLGRDQSLRAAPRRRGCGGLVTAFDELVGVELGPSSWIEVSQARIDAFAAATDDPQWIHVDPERAAAGPFGTTIAHGYLTLSLASRCSTSSCRPPRRWS